MTVLQDRFVKKLALRAYITDSDSSALHRLLKDLVFYDKDEIIVRQGEVASSAYVFLDGFACRYRNISETSRSIISYLLPGDGCFLHGSIIGKTVHSISTLTPCAVVPLSFDSIKRLVAHHPNIYQALWWSVLVDESITQEWLIGLGRRAAEKRVAHFYCEMLMRLQVVGLASENRYDLPLTQAELADMVGMSAYHLNRVLNSLCKLRIMEQRGKEIFLPNIAEIKRFAGFESDYLYLSPNRAQQDKLDALSNVARLGVSID